MAEVIRLRDYMNPWKEVTNIRTESSTLQVHVNQFTGDVEIAQMNDDGEAIRTQLDAIDAELLKAALGLKQKRKAR